MEKKRQDKAGFANSLVTRLSFAICIAFVISGVILSVIAMNSAASAMEELSQDSAVVAASLADMRSRLIVTAVILMIFFALVFYAIITVLLKPISTLIEIIYQTSDLDLRHNPKSGALCARKDEFGLIANAIRAMRASLREIVDGIHASSGTIDSNVVDLNSNAETVNEMCTDNSATTQELAASMAECASSAAEINKDISNIQNSMHQIEMQTNDGSTVSDEIMDRATDLKNTTEKASNTTRSIYSSVKARSDKAIENSKAVEKINELTDTIMAISSQTSLLALNASIEAARAGEAGRGFAVVATEIGNLANQTSTAVADIDGIVSEVNSAVSQMQSCLEEMGKFLEETVLKDYADFQKVGVQYQDDADIFKDSMSSIKNSVDELTEFIANIVGEIGAIKNTIGESSEGVADIAAKTTDIVRGMSETNVKVSECRTLVEKLEELVGRFIVR
ncbi:MAG: methyl-accepting chemotaxis protein [Lachnospiraceae bacterium]|nr:methyl-accepting chemotaxis protein [Lachnospiraceae bacterium]